MLVESRSLCAVLQAWPLGSGWFPSDNKAKYVLNYLLNWAPKEGAPLAFHIAFFF